MVATLNLFLSQHVCVHHLHLHGHQGERFKGQAAPVHVVVLETHIDKAKDLSLLLFSPIEPNYRIIVIDEGILNL